ncbi:MAG TPA: hypothetical protein HA271_08275, partial [Methanobacterium subterraneum]|nr:hypothetical protein [Methanobacterium subterraneum]
MKTNKNYMRGELVYSEMGNKKTDYEGSPVCGVRMDASRAYKDIPELLQKVIDEDDDAAW